MNVAFGVKQDVVRLHVAMDDAMVVNVAQGTTELSHPEADGLLCKGLSRSVEPQVAAVHEINDEVAVRVSMRRFPVALRRGTSRRTDIQHPEKSIGGYK